MDNKYPQLTIGAFIINDRGELFLRTTPSQDNRYTCINGKVRWGETIEKTLKDIVKEKTNLDIISFELIGLTDGLNIKNNNDSESVNMIFADYKVKVGNIKQFKTDEDREYKWLLPSEWLTINKNIFSPYIFEIIEELAN